MATCDNIDVDLTPVDFEVSLYTSPCYDVDIVQSDVTIEAISIAGQGPQGNAATIAVGTTTTTAPGGAANVVNVGDTHNAIFNFAIPTGNAGPPGSPGTQGSAATIAVGATNTLPAGQPATVSNAGTVNAAVLTFGIPQGIQGVMGQSLKPKGTVANAAALPPTGNTTGDIWVTSDTQHSWGWNGTAWVDMGSLAGPPGAAGSPGAAGPAATLNAGTTITTAPGTSASVTNVGTTSAAIFNFGIPRGDVGATGATGSQGLQGNPGPAGPSAISANANNKAVLGSDSLILVQGTAAGIAATTHAQTVSGDDPQLTNARTPTVHAVTHKSGGSDAIALDTLAVPTDITTLNASTTAHGLLRKLSGTTTQYLDGGGNWSIPVGGGFISKTAAYTLTSSDSGKYFICSGGSWTLTLPSPAIGLIYQIRNDMGIASGSTTGTITLSPPSGTIDGASSLALLPQQDLTVITDGTNWRTLGRQRDVILGTLDITSSTASGIVLLPVGYRYFELEFTGFLPVNSSDALFGQFSTDGGSTWLASTLYYYGEIYNSSATATAFVNNEGVGNVSFIPNALNTGNATSISKVVLYPGSATKGATWTVDAGSRHPSLYQYKWNGYGFLNQGGPVNALKYSCNTGNISILFLTVKGVV